MKKCLFMLCLISVFILAACGEKVDPIELPKVQEINSIDVTIGENTVNYTDKTLINEVISEMSDSVPTQIESVHDVPQVENYIKIEFKFDVGSKTLFVYEDCGNYYVEQPYHGIYKIDCQLYGQLQK